MGQSALDKILIELQREDKARADLHQEELQKLYRALPDMINEVAQEMNIDAATLVKLAHWTTRNYENVTWTGFISMLRTFYVYKENEEKQ